MGHNEQETPPPMAVDRLERTASEDPSATSDSESLTQPARHASGIWREDMVNVLRGFCMGAADTVPGVSGGTVALILGHYQRLVTAVSNADLAFLRQLSNRRFQAASQHIDLRFLAAIGVGIALGAVTLAGIMHWLLDHRRPQTYAVFFGLIFASAWIVGRQIDRWPLSRFLACTAGIIAAVLLGFVPVGEGSASPEFLFLSGAIAICAMILPGISGAFILLLLGSYHTVTGLIKGLPRGELTFQGFAGLVAFLCGCGVGLLAFSRLLSWLLEHHRGTTLAALLGLMLGSLAKLWPLQRVTAETAGLEAKLRQYVFVSPADWEGSIISLVGLMALAAGIVFLAEWLASRYAEQTSAPDAPRS